MSEGIDHTQMNPNDLQHELLNFVGGIYGQISEYDKNLVGPNINLRPMKDQFNQLARTVLTDIPNAPRINPQPPQQHIQHQVPQISQQHSQPFIDTGRNIPRIDGDPNQMEFNFDNSVTATTIYSKIDELEKRIKRIDNNLQKIVELLNEPDDSE